MRTQVRYSCARHRTHTKTGFQSHQPKTLARAQALHQPPAESALRLVSLGENIAVAQLMSLYLQAFDNQPGISIPFRELDYGRVSDWLKTILALDPIGQYPLFLASQVYPQVPDPARTRSMFDFVYQEFLADPARRWRWLAHSALARKTSTKRQQACLALRKAKSRGWRPMLLAGHVKCRFSYSKISVRLRARRSCLER